jgi:translation initiation factor 1
MAVDTCTTCGLPDELCVCEDIAKERVELTVETETRRYGKHVTLISGFDDTTDVDDLSSELKSSFACGGTVTNAPETVIELQGNHFPDVVEFLTDRGFAVVE